MQQISQEISLGVLKLPIQNPLIREFTTDDMIKTWVSNAFYAKDGLKESVDYLFPKSMSMSSASGTTRDRAKKVSGQVWNELMSPELHHLNVDVVRAREKLEAVAELAGGNSNYRNINSDTSFFDPDGDFDSEYSTEDYDTARTTRTTSGDGAIMLAEEATDSMTQSDDEVSDKILVVDQDTGVEEKNM